MFERQDRKSLFVKMEQSPIILFAVSAVSLREACNDAFEIGL
jgi:hypothetical protein